MPIARPIPGYVPLSQAAFRRKEPRDRTLRAVLTGELEGRQFFGLWYVAEHALTEQPTTATPLQRRRKAG